MDLISASSGLKVSRSHVISRGLRLIANTLIDNFLPLIVMITYSKVTEENIAPLVLDVCQDHQYADDHGEDDGDHHHQSAVDHLEQTLYFETF